MDSYIIKLGFVGYSLSLALSQHPVFGAVERIGLAGAAICFASAALWSARHRWF